MNMQDEQEDADRPYAREGYLLMAAAFEVHNELGGGLLEEIYQQALELELSSLGIEFTSKQTLAVYYKGQQLRKFYEPDLRLFGAIIVELKAVSSLATEHEAQLLNYMRISRHPIGYLINFGPLGKLQWKRFVLSEYLKK